MLYINIASDEKQFFSELQKQYPDAVTEYEEFGFDSGTLVQMIIDITKIPEFYTSVAAIVAAILVYRVNKKSNELKEKQIELDGKNSLLEHTLKQQELSLKQVELEISLKKLENQLAQPNEEVKETPLSVEIREKGTDPIQLMSTDEVYELLNNPEKISDFQEKFENKLKQKQ